MRAVVVGGGVAGSACAVALRRIGMRVTVYERHEDPGGPVGSFVSLAANGLRSLAALGCLAAVQLAGFAVPRQRMWSAAGKLLADVPRGRRVDDPLHSITVMRADLVSVLRAEAGRLGANIVTGERPTHATADLVVGADGIWSETRRLVVPSAPEPTYAGTYTVSGVSTGQDEEPGTFNMIFARHGTFLYLPAPDGTVWWSVQIVSIAPLEDPAAAFTDAPRATAILGATRETHGTTLNHVLPPLPAYHKDRTILVGDAAHPVGAGQGASLAIEDAVVLAQHLDRAPTVPQALATYTEARRPRTAKLAKLATSNREAKTAGALTSHLRNLIMPIVFPRMYPRATNWLHTFDPGLLPVTTEVAR